MVSQMRLQHRKYLRNVAYVFVTNIHSTFKPTAMASIVVDIEIIVVDVAQMLYRRWTSVSPLGPPILREVTVAGWMANAR